jgi:ABC-2 type transport system permease protein
MMRGFWKLTWIETKVFVREPMGVIGSLLIPVVVFVLLGRAFNMGEVMPDDAPTPPFNVPVMAALFIAIGSVLSLVAIISIYREGGILKRLRATPLTPVTILSAHVFVKLLFTIVSLALLVLAGRQFFPGAMGVNMLSFTAALLLSSLSILSMGFVLASLVRTARFAQPVGAAVLYPMIAISGLFFPIEVLSRPLQLVAYSLPTTNAVALMTGIWDGAGWGAHWWNVLGLVVAMAASLALSTKVFRWE